MGYDIIIKLSAQGGMSPECFWWPERVDVLTRNDFGGRLNIAIQFYVTQYMEDRSNHNNLLPYIELQCKGYRSLRFSIPLADES